MVSKVNVVKIAIRAQCISTVPIFFLEGLHPYWEGNIFDIMLKVLLIVFFFY